MQYSTLGPDLFIYVVGSMTIWSLIVVFSVLFLGGHGQPITFMRVGKGVSRASCLQIIYSLFNVHRGSLFTVLCAQLFLITVLDQNLFPVHRACDLLFPVQACTEPPLPTLIIETVPDFIPLEKLPPISSKK